MNILFIGDIFGSPGRILVARYLQEIISSEKIQLAIANAENSAGGFGVTPSIAEELFSLGLDVLTSGNHIWDKKEIFEYMTVPVDSHVRAIRRKVGSDVIRTVHSIGYAGADEDGD